MLPATNLGDDELVALDSSFASSSATNYVWLVEFLSFVLVGDDLPNAILLWPTSLAAISHGAFYAAAENVNLARICPLMLQMLLT